METKKIIITEPGQISSKDKEKLTKAGYIVIEAKDKSKVHMLSDAEIVPSNFVIMAALHSLKESDIRSGHFVRKLHELLNDVK